MLQVVWVCVCAHYIHYIHQPNMRAYTQTHTHPTTLILDFSAIPNLAPSRSSASVHRPRARNARSVRCYNARRRHRCRAVVFVAAAAEPLSALRLRSPVGSYARTPRREGRGRAYVHIAFRSHAHRAGRAVPLVRFARASRAKTQFENSCLSIRP